MRSLIYTRIYMRGKTRSTLMSHGGTLMLTKDRDHDGGLLEGLTEGIVVGEGRPIDGQNHIVKARRR